MKVIIIFLLLLLGVGVYALVRRVFHKPFGRHMTGNLGGSGMMTQGHMEDPDRPIKKT